MTNDQTTTTRSALSTFPTASPITASSFHLRNWDIRFPQGEERITDAFYDEVTS